MPEDAKERLAGNIAARLARVSEVKIVERSLAHFHEADPEYGDCADWAVKARRERLRRTA